MSAANDAEVAGDNPPPATVKVWDLFVRLFHWSLVVLFLMAYATGDELEKIHIVVGYLIAGLVAVRVVWGFVGFYHARFSNFVRPPGETLAYLFDEILFRAPRHIGHNPAASAMIVALLVVLATTCITGYMITSNAHWGTKWIEEVHEALANITIGLIAVHVLGVLMASLSHRENLILSMITGRKRP